MIVGASGVWGAIMPTVGECGGRVMTSVAGKAVTVAGGWATVMVAGIGVLVKRAAVGRSVTVAGMSVGAAVEEAVGVSVMVNVRVGGGVAVGMGVSVVVGVNEAVGDGKMITSPASGAERVMIITGLLLLFEALLDNANPSIPNPENSVLLPLFKKMEPTTIK